MKILKNRKNLNRSCECESRYFMKCSEYYVTVCPDNNIEREDDHGNSQICSGYFCEVYRDAEYKNCCDYFSLAFGHDIPEDSEEAVRLGVCQYLGLDLNEDLLEVKSLTSPVLGDCYTGIAM